MRTRPWFPPVLEDPAGPPPAAVVRARPLVLVVEDYDDLRESVADLLSGTGLDVLPARDPWQALMGALRERPDVVLLEPGTPRLQGMSILRWLRSRRITREIPIVCWSTRRDLEATALGLGAFAYLVKPVEPAALAFTLRRAVGGSHG